MIYGCIGRVRTATIELRLRSGLAWR
ncbi:UDP-glucose 6-dehydrogenase-related protein [Caulobacter vibrioides]|uniref:UDP-glucose 6-dehydrogenase-related protein n=1 Tax=Caulobacter vibrioides (strain NA1000 / CB15N) TaxID=565050 RepID=A0A0H3J1S8_CAUVN|nr:UDP-glucose 6-dehydrogenase-related protein [Caulobacter vibrioides]YP_009020564.1 UDP-glucose 6-dehydrogenase-related protein [Caulobacter vibrioides NA1000]AHI88595.1 UDP-glucose 6-dehydrogenase-related protein [Caulobacter vibrioides NA1000]AVH77134.1 hypothetical protein CA607_20615 [Caulobacter vibrioides]QXZ54026.1 hypothetical protein KZH45_17730 [Caulobacter vibrioides]